MKHKLILLAMAGCFAINVYSQWTSYPFSPAGSVLTFPQDDGLHTALNTNTEWWYINMHLIGAAPSFKKYDVMLCYFNKPANMRIFNVATPGTGVFHTDVNQTPATLTAQIGHWDLAYTIPFSISDYSRWTYPTNSKTFSYIFHATSPTNQDGLDLTITSNRTPLIVGKNGFIPIGGGGDSSFYYSISNMKVQGSIKFGGITDTLSSGIAWIDRQWGPFTVGTNPSNMYEWFSLQVDKPGTTFGTPQTPSEFNVWQIFSDSTNVPYTRAYRLISGIYPDSTQDTISNYIFERTGYWYDAIDNKYYSQGWRIINPTRGMNIDMTATIQNQVINVTLFKFWEGSTTLKGTVENKPVDGVGFAELVAARSTPIITPSVPSNLSITPATNHYTLNWSASTAGTYPIGGYRVFRSTTNTGYWQYIASTTNLSYDDYSAVADSGYYYTVSSFDNQTHTSASAYATGVWVNPLYSGINQIIESNNSIQVYPNPTTDVLNLTISQFDNLKMYKLEVYNMLGECVHRQIATSSNCQIDVSDLAEGVYQFIIQNSGAPSGSFTINKRVVIVK
ncbi:MAG: lipocalin-like domain-containing protein [Bacteroidia bacterium]